MCLQDRGACSNLEMASSRARVTGHPSTLPLGVPELPLPLMHQLTGHPPTLPLGVPELTLALMHQLRAGADGLVTRYLSARLLLRVARTFPKSIHSSVTWKPAGTL